MLEEEYSNFILRLVISPQSESAMDIMGAQFDVIKQLGAGRELAGQPLKVDTPSK